MKTSYDPDEQLRKAFEEADAREPRTDVDALWRRTSERLDAPALSRASNRTPKVLLIAAAASVAAAVGVAGLVHNDRTDQPAPPSTSTDTDEAFKTVRGPVSSTWACANPIDTTNRPKFKDLRAIRGPAHEQGVPLFDILRDGDHAEVRYGNADGKLTGRLELTNRHRSGDTGLWWIDRWQYCFDSSVYDAPTTSDPASLTLRVPAAPNTIHPVPVSFDTRPYVTQLGSTGAQTLSVLRTKCGDKPMQPCSVMSVDMPSLGIDFIALYDDHRPVCKSFLSQDTRLAGLKVCGFSSTKPVQTVEIGHESGEATTLERVTPLGWAHGREFWAATAPEGAQPTSATVTYTDGSTRTYRY